MVFSQRFKVVLGVVSCAIVMGGLACSSSRTTADNDVRSQRDIAKVQNEVTPYRALKSRFEMRKGVTLLDFVSNTLRPAIAEYDSMIRDSDEYKNKNYGGLQKMLIREGAGVAVRIDEGNYFFNVGYNNG